MKIYFQIFISFIIVFFSSCTQKFEYNKLSGDCSVYLIQINKMDAPGDSLYKKIPEKYPLSTVAVRLILSDTILGISLEKCGKSKNDISMHRSKFIFQT